MKKLKHNPCGYKLKDYFKRFFLSHIEKMLFYRIKLKYLNKKRFLSYIEKTQFFSCEHKVCVCVNGPYNEKIKYFSSIYIVNFDMG